MEQRSRKSTLGVKKCATTPKDSIPSQSHPNATATSSKKMPHTNLVPEDDSDSDAEDDAKDSMQIRKPPSALSMNPPGLPVSTTRGKQKEAGSRSARTETRGQGI